MRSIVLAAVISSAASVCPVAAQERGVYLGGELGLAASTKLDMTFTPGATAGSVGRLDADQDPGFSGSMLVGYDFGRFRIEAEASRLTAGIDGARSDWGLPSGLVVGDQALDGDVGATSALLNVTVDVLRRGDYAFFVGGGAGKTRVKVSGMALEQGGAVLVDDRDADRRSSWQLVGGIRKSFSDHFEGHVRYRYLEVDDVQMIGIGGRVIDVRLSSHSLAAGITYRF